MKKSNAATEGEPQATTDASSSQPSCKRQRTFGVYTFYRYQDAEEKWLSVERELPPETHCWVQQSRGKKRKSSKQLLSRAWVVSPEKDYESANGKERRILVRYPKGSTYHVKRSNLQPILLEEQVVVVCPETNLYRRWAKLHTQANDSFVEIGCDIGILVEMIREHSSCPDRVWGLDKAEDDILEAKKRYPNCNFLAWNVPLQDENNEKENEDDPTSTSKPPPLPTGLFPPTDQDATMNPSLVVAVDINGTRELEAVQKCVQIVIDEWKPRLIVVKSRTLYADLADGDNTVDEGTGTC